MVTVLMLSVMAILFLSMSLMPVRAQTVSTQDVRIDSMTVSVKMESNGTSVVVIDAVVTNVASTPLTEISLRIDSMELVIVAAQADAAFVAARLDTMERHTMVVFSLTNSLMVNETVMLHVLLRSFDLQSNPETVQSNRLLYRSLIFYLRPHNPVFDFTFITALPIRGALSTSSLVPLFPAPQSNRTDGQSLLFEWHVPYLQPGQEKVFIVKYSVPMDPVASGEASSLLYGLLLSGGLLLGASLVMVGPPMKQYLFRLRAVHYIGTTSEEKAIIDMLRKKGGSCRQKELYLDLDILESKMSLLLSSMESRGLIRRFRKGREKMVYLTEEHK
ncbi:MAG: helix-turn-helix transcriptional regulator [Candidatus Thorarchaeota archaeon]